MNNVRRSASRRLGQAHLGCPDEFIAARDELARPISLARVLDAAAWEGEKANASSSKNQALYKMPLPCSPDS